MILDEIAAKTRIRISEKKKQLPLSEICVLAQKRAAVEKGGNGGFTFPFEKAIGSGGMSFICEVKKASPSKGVIAEDFPYLQIALEYEKAGADALSVLTEPYFFQGSDRYLREIAKKVVIPILRKDFTVDSYMIYEAKLMGASEELLICAILSDDELKDYIRISQGLGLSALVEAHDEKEVYRAIACGARIIGVNNRDLHTFQVDLCTGERLRGLVPESILFVSESGIANPSDIKKLKANKTDAVLIGETMMKSRDKTLLLREFREV